MASTVIVVDHADKDLGAFFQLCINDLNTFFNDTAIQPFFLNSGNLNDLSVKLITQSLNKFVFVAYSHGLKNCLLNANTPYVSTTLNNTCFGGSFFYTFSCSSGFELGDNLIQNGCSCFIGYKKDINIWSTSLPPFVTCANHGLKLFFQGLNSSQILAEMKSQYNIEIDSLYPKNYLISSILRENRDALVLHGNDINIKSI